jgi:predicted metal-dependent HD superfamily phosphohydrolase
MAETSETPETPTAPRETPATPPETVDPGPRLREAWTQLVGTVPGATAAGTYLLEAYSEPHRRYHDVRHLAEALDHVDELAPYADDPDAVRLAAWLHDAVYQPTRSDNEEQSAVLAEQLLPVLEVPAERVAEVARLVRLTARHEVGEDDRNGAVLCDADLAVLGADPGRYAGYAAGVRVEYAHVGEQGFATGRAEVLRGLLAHDPLFRTPTAQQRWSERARANLEAELRWLTPDGVDDADPRR